MSLSAPRGCKAVAEADLRRTILAPVKARDQGAVCSRQRDAGCELEESEFCSVHGIVKELLHLQEGPAAGVAHLPGAQEAACPTPEDATLECEVREDAENGFCSNDGSVREPLGSQGTSAAGNVHKRILRRLLGKRFWSHPVAIWVSSVLLTAVLTAVLSLAVLSARQAPVPPVPVQGCPCGWVGYCGTCYYFSRDHGTWEQGQERCSELGASLAILKHEEMHWFFRLRGNTDYWLGLRRRGEHLQWVDGSNFSSWVPVLGNSECVYLADDKFRSADCSNEQPYLCSMAQTPPL
ncbi:early activation antigen CD69-like [Poecile atricapillus]|uniref:early activation antigen CD69-like n=1 Tax=Poecile atricapillus TaxID=48891 RepID=UPI0027395BFF|nr:early activation antigen CD69-like [Poecile atricapillus]XP_058698003.1 early activation antigen CD69-like [Poecile atricapillus]